MVGLGSVGRWAIALGLLAAQAQAFGGNTTKHEKGRCAIRGQCEPAGFFGPGRPCADNGHAEDPSSQLRKRLVDICGDKWSGGPVCCDDEQVRCFVYPHKRFRALKPCRSMLSRATWVEWTPSLPHVLLARTTSTTFSVPSPAHQTNRLSSMSPRRSRVAASK